MNKAKDVSDAEIKKISGKAFHVWKAIINELNIFESGQAAAEKYLVEKYRLNPSVASTIVIKYEFEAGIRKK